MEMHMYNTKNAEVMMVDCGRDFLRTEERYHGTTSIIVHIPQLCCNIVVTLYCTHCPIRMCITLHGRQS